MSPFNTPAVGVWTGITDRFYSRPVQKPDQLTIVRPNLHQYPSPHRYRRVRLDLPGPISGSACPVSHLWSHSDIQRLIVKDSYWYVRLYFRRIGRLDVQNKHTHTPNHILKMSVHRASTIYGLASAVT
jgi:hypothetical protein